MYGLAGLDGDPRSTESGLRRVVVRRGVVSCVNGSCSCASREEAAMIGRDGRVSESLSTRDAIGRFVQARSETASSKGAEG